MRSKASFKSHPLHPILVSFPIAFFIGTFICDIIIAFSSSDSLHHTSFILNAAGIGGALLAAIPGIIDFIYTVPPESSGKKRAAKHGILNVVVLIIFSVALSLKSNEASPIAILVTETIGVVLLSISGWLGGTLVYRNQIGVDPRYADAGKWKDERVEESPRIQVAEAGELKNDQMKLIRVGSQRIVIAKTSEGYVAFDDRCTHRGGSLAGGAMICGTAQCPWHGSQFKGKDGAVVAGPATERVKTYPLEESEGKIFLLRK